MNKIKYKKFTFRVEICKVCREETNAEMSRCFWSKDKKEMYYLCGQCNIDRINKEVLLQEKWKELSEYCRRKK